MIPTIQYSATLLYDAQHNAFGTYYSETYLVATCIERPPLKNYQI